MTLTHARTICRHHWVALAFAVVAGIVMVLPQLWFMAAEGSSYQGIVMTGSDAETHYLARIREASEGNGIGNPYFFEDKSLPTSQFTFVETALALPSILFGWSVPAVNLFYKFFFGVVVFLLAYFLYYRLIHRRDAALAAASLAIVSPMLFSLGDIRNILLLHPVYENFVPYARPVNPSVSGVVLFAYLHLLLTFWNGTLQWSKKIWKIVGLATLFAIAPYVYFYTWTFIGALNGVVFLALIFAGRIRDAVHILLVTAVGFLVAIPYLLNTITFTAHPHYLIISKTFGFVYSHAPRVSLVGVLCTLIFAGGVWYAKKWNTESKFIVLLILTSLLVVNQQIVSGQLLQEGHFHWYYNIPVFAVALWYGIVALFDRFSFQKIIPFLVMGAVALAFSSAGFIQAASYHNLKERSEAEQAYGPLMQWLKWNATPEAVVLADNEISEWIPVYTSQNVYWSNFGFTYLTSQVRVMFTLFMYLRLYGITPEEMPETAFHVPTVGGDRAYQYPETTILLGDKKTYLTDFYPPNMSYLYSLFYQNPMERRLREFRVDYIAVDTRKEQNWLSVIPASATKVFEEGPIILFKL